MNIENKSEVTQITVEQTSIAFDFLNYLFSDDVEGYWNTISKVDQARVYGMFKAAKAVESIDESMIFLNYVRDYFKVEQEKMFEKLKDNNPGVASFVRYTEEGEALVYMLEDVQVQRVYIAETQELVFPILLTVDTEVNKGNIESTWKVRLYKERDYKNLNSY